LIFEHRHTASISQTATNAGDWIQKLRLVSADGTGKRSRTGGLRDENPRRLLRHTPPGTPDGYSDYDSPPTL